ncbi:MAG: hypothetical protein DSY60_06035 [Persephonella sp.]|nr:MAG: hypothetical protein DSY60_06035 [Persephonella sp.]
MKKVIGSLVAMGLLTSSAMAGTLTVAHTNLELSGGITAGFFMIDKTNNNNDPGAKDYFRITSLDIELSSKVNDTIGFVLDFGNENIDNNGDEFKDTLLTGDPSQAGNRFGVHYAYISIRPIDNLTIDAGKLATNVGYELAHTFENPNVFYGMVWYAQPFLYNGVRITYEFMDNLSLYFEYNQDTLTISNTTARDAFAVGVLGNLMNVDFAISYYDYSNLKNLVDIVLSTKLGSLDVALNFDYQWMDDTLKNDFKNQGATSIDDSAYGIALYLTPNLTETLSVPIRLEYVNDGKITNNAGVNKDDGLYGISGDSAYSITITPTYKPTKNSFVRAEFGYIKMDNITDLFKNGDGVKKDSRYVYGVEAGYMF